ncbi:MAG: 1-(5-phosphoribosyl)-5-[(5-phosphoribosylamino)methylideneamino] imidazole-4-carboxamide isomerase [Clostridiales bacterium 38_11]|nr:MAG: 1-(5-phosphoribosyl)-5-[(5-phosphoribosylamino)methylideneamino] imidazole-4-carboxamide isomerase [Clostridiales bacterium 38_11]HBH12371.1 1-(5-phosphoribosyl)-5-[(5-phosphoribosylamino)methylideneamino]imidazole-4-carboxamide isomerase [Clostridiales bacterium]
MILYPAVDIKDNKCVRLTQGDFNRIKVYSDNPVDMAIRWEQAGAEYLHVVDLDGAESESLINKQSIREIAKSISIPIQIGGGIRTGARIEELLSLGISRVILGTIAVENQELLMELATNYANQMAVSVDAVEGKAAIRGWKDATSVDVIDICEIMEKSGIKTLIYTDILRDGMLKGPNTAMYKRLQDMTDLDIIASGGVTTIQDIKDLKAIEVYGAIIGKALYDGNLDFKEALKCLQKE